MSGETASCDRVAGCADDGFIKNQAHSSFEENNVNAYVTPEREHAREEGGVLQSSEDEGHDESSAPDTEAVSVLCPFIFETK
jgi:hypothetical protein